MKTIDKFNNPIFLVAHQYATAKPPRNLSAPFAVKTIGFGPNGFRIKANHRFRTVSGSNVKARLFRLLDASE